MNMPLQRVASALVIRLAAPGAIAAPTQNPQIFPAVRSAFRQRDDVIHGEILRSVRRNAPPLTQITIPGTVCSQYLCSDPSVLTVIPPLACASAFRIA